MKDLYAKVPNILEHFLHSFYLKKFIGSFISKVSIKEIYSKCFIIKILYFI